MSFIKQALTALKRIFIVVGIAVAFTLGLVGAIYLSLRSSETKVPDIIGKDRTSAESTISSAGLNFRVRATRPTSDAKPDTVLIQLPHAGEIVKVGQTVAVDISRPTKDGESSTSASSTANANTERKPENTNSANSNSNSSSNSNSNDNKEKKKPANKNTNDNLNTNEAANRAANRNRNTNVNSLPTGNKNASPAGTPVRSNLNSNSAPSSNANRPTGNVNSNRRQPVVAPTP